MTEEEYQELIPELKTANDGRPLQIEWWLDWIGQPAYAIAFSTLFWPDFIEHEDCVLRGTSVPETYPSWKESHPDDPGTIEWVLNHKHISDLFHKYEWTPEQVLFIGKKLKEAWTAKLKQDFPDRNFIVEFDEDFDFETDNPKITFYQER